VVHRAHASKPHGPTTPLHVPDSVQRHALHTLMSAAFLSFFFMACLTSRASSATAVSRAGDAIRCLQGRDRRADDGCAGAVELAFGPKHVVYARDLLLPMALPDLGGGLCFPALTLIAMSGTSPSDSGLASGLLNTNGQVGGALGLAVFVTIAALARPP
jgi:hypothetical protein